jgi:Cation transporting ATPase, C-terminus
VKLSRDFGPWFKGGIKKKKKERVALLEEGVVAAYESRSVSLTALTADTFDNARMNWIALAELGLAVMISQLDPFNRLLDTVPLKAGQFGLALASAVLLLALWEVGKLIAHRRASSSSSGHRSAGAVARPATGS